MFKAKCVENSSEGSLEVGMVYDVVGEQKWQGFNYYQIKIDDKVFLYLKGRFEVNEE